MKEPERVPRTGDDFLWDYADPSGGWSESWETVADVIGREVDGWRVEFGQGQNPFGVPEALKSAYPELLNPRIGSTVITWRDGRWVCARREHPERRPRV